MTDLKAQSKQLEFFEIPSPCVGVCESGPRGFSKGCYRSRDERLYWLKVDDATKRKRCGPAGRMMTPRIWTCPIGPASCPWRPVIWRRRYRLTCRWMRRCRRACWRAAGRGAVKGHYLRHLRPAALCRAANPLCRTSFSDVAGGMSASGKHLERSRP